MDHRGVMFPAWFSLGPKLKSAPAQAGASLYPGAVMARYHVCACIGCAAHPGSCPELTLARHCIACGSVREQARGSRQQRGYDRQHERLRKQWKPKVDSCLVDCARCGQRIWLGQAWHLDHTDDRAGYLGPSHQACNTSAGGKAAHR